MLEDRANDWEKTKKQSQSGPKKVDDLRNEIIKKQKDEERIRQTAEKEEYSYLEKQGSGKGGNYNKHGGDQQRYQEKGGQGGRKTQGGQKEYRDRDDRKPNPCQRKDEPTNYKVKPIPTTTHTPKINSDKPKVIVIEIEDKDLEKRVISNFAGFVDML